MIALDVDGIIADFYLGCCRRFNIPYTKITTWDFPWLSEERWKEIEHDEDFWLNLPVLSPPESITFDFDMYMTSLPESMADARYEWLIKNGFPDKPVVVSHNKAEDCIKKGVKLLIDDKPQTIIDCDVMALDVIQFIPNYYLVPNYTVKVITHLSEVNQFLK